MSAMKNLAIKQVKKEMKDRYKEKKRVEFGENRKLDIDLRFRPSVKNDVKKELIRVLTEALEQNKPLDAGMLLGLQTMLAIKHFTTIVTDAATLDDYMEMLHALHDGGYTERILEAFDRDELAALYTELNDALQLFNRAMEAELAKAKEADAADEAGKPVKAVKATGKTGAAGKDDKRGKTKTGKAEKTDRTGKTDKAIDMEIAEEKGSKRSKSRSADQAGKETAASTGDSGPDAASPLTRSSSRASARGAKGEQ
ncbi:hypothetical protein WJ0W_003479 [Paenibacillus melissococcoides]|uniref:Uncharacterized protein n=1 Tax=Paenibacillus melissococcoides TaxID=2912268 RepID=A0ABM9G3H5_9BACL|nr:MULTISPECIES: hypothetical protein [Paenibacillus]MEB9896815.1 hypothetical protein [Bacillus cereus]CAH8246244.1 hypothetical protein WJ0W_003479 [Paenibacillus melissococcoides]CAH8713389.1 hypothetical protein WDD9_003552 [Paenibacillus melissococcoides]CAH8714122.1 hypothetical protein HTL2_003855 [Paenibacillus melissococcoides]GIO81415.1 hypothetical protein J6TS7_50250 [Paenibacillus dendritiformis]